ncbi:MAG TPA: hypothetical protein VEQ61_06860, partial [Thermoleophilaceae bacterium]|nr:hypothetical protein [Thermoleophilaceae bacterium]
RSSNEDSEFGEPLARLEKEIEADKRALEGFLETLGFNPDRPKVAAAWAGEKLGRLKLNGQLTGYSPLSRLVEIEGLVVGVQGKGSLWRSLREAAAREPRLDADYLDRLVARADEQSRQLAELRDRAARLAFGQP